MDDLTQIVERIAKRVPAALLRRLADNLDNAAARNVDGELRLSVVLDHGIFRSAKIQPPWESVEVAP